MPSVALSVLACGFKLRVGGEIITMMGKTHEMIGSAAWLGAVETIPVLGHIGWLAILGGWGLAYTAGLGPDIDHPKATITNMLGPVTRGIHNLLSALGVKHRGMTHSFFAAGFVALIVGSLCTFSGICNHG